MYYLYVYTCHISAERDQGFLIYGAILRAAFWSGDLDSNQSLEERPRVLHRLNYRPFSRLVYRLYTLASNHLHLLQRSSSHYRMRIHPYPMGSYASKSYKPVLFLRYFLVHLFLQCTIQCFLRLGFSHCRLELVVHCSCVRRLYLFFPWYNS